MNNLLKELPEKINITIAKSDLMEFAQFLIQETLKKTVILAKKNKYSTLKRPLSSVDLLPKPFTKRLPFVKFLTTSKSENYSLNIMSL